MLQHRASDIHREHAATSSFFISNASHCFRLHFTMTAIFASHLPFCRKHADALCFYAINTPCQSAARFATPHACVISARKHYHFAIFRNARSIPLADVDAPPAFFAFEATRLLGASASPRARYGWPATARPFATRAMQPSGHFPMPSVPCQLRRRPMMSLATTTPGQPHATRTSPRHHRLMRFPAVKANIESTQLFQQYTLIS